MLYPKKVVLFFMAVFASGVSSAAELHVIGFPDGNERIAREITSEYIKENLGKGVTSGTLTSASIHPAKDGKVEIYLEASGTSFPTNSGHFCHLPGLSDSAASNLIQSMQENEARIICVYGKGSSAGRPSSYAIQLNLSGR